VPDEGTQDQFVAGGGIGGAAEATGPGGAGVGTPPGAFGALNNPFQTAADMGEHTRTRVAARRQMEAEDEAARQAAPLTTEAATGITRRRNRRTQTELMRGDSKDMLDYAAPTLSSEEDRNRHFAVHSTMEGYEARGHSRRVQARSGNPHIRYRGPLWHGGGGRAKRSRQGGAEE
jgi:hypothetical protein